MDRDLALQLITKLGAIVTQLEAIVVNTTPADSGGGEPDAEPTAVENTRSAKK